MAVGFQPLDGVALSIHLTRSHVIASRLNVGLGLVGCRFYSGYLKEPSISGVLLLNYCICISPLVCMVLPRVNGRRQVPAPKRYDNLKLDLREQAVGRWGSSHFHRMC